VDLIAEEFGRLFALGSSRVLEIYMFYAPEQGTQAEQQPLTDGAAADGGEQQQEQQQPAPTRDLRAIAAEPGPASLLGGQV